VRLTIDTKVAGSNLEAGTQLAQRNQRFGSLDGEYLFASLHDAKDFAVLSLEFTRLLMEKSIEGVKGHNFYATPAWVNPHVHMGPEAASGT
jgi:hypothetical protein